MAVLLTFDAAGLLVIPLALPSLMALPVGGGFHSFCHVLDYNWISVDIRLHGFDQRQNSFFGLVGVIDQLSLLAYAYLLASLFCESDSGSGLLVHSIDFLLSLFFLPCYPLYSQLPVHFVADDSQLLTESLLKCIFKGLFRLAGALLLAFLRHRFLAN